jgi:acetylornithine/N-succinyldiaminopimelate aminotransferase
MTVGTHGSTYGGNPLACAVGAAVVEIVADDAFLSEVRRKAASFRQGLEGLVASHPDVIERGARRGPDAGPPPQGRARGLRQGRLRRGRPHGPAADNVVRLLPPLNIPDEDISEALRRLDAAASALKPS